MGEELRGGCDTPKAAGLVLLGRNRSSRVDNVVKANDLSSVLGRDRGREQVSYGQSDAGSGWVDRR